MVKVYRLYIIIFFLVLSIILPTNSYASSVLNFPADHGSHPSFNTEWWYLNMIVRTAGEDVSDQKYLASVLSFSRISGTKNLLSSNFNYSTGAFEESTEQNGNLDVSLKDDNRMFVQFSKDQTLTTLEEQVTGSDRKKSFRLRGKTANLGSFDLTLKERTVVSAGFNIPLAWGGKDGDCKGRISVFSEDDTYYYSIPDLDISGTITYPEGTKRRVLDGKAWIDHQWFNSKPPPDWKGHYWTNLHYKKIANTYDPYSAFGFVTQIYSDGPKYTYWVKRNADGTNECGEDGSITINEYWPSNFPLYWNINTSTLNLEGSASSDNQIFQPPVGPKFTETASHYQGFVDSMAFTGNGFFETHLTKIALPSPGPKLKEVLSISVNFQDLSLTGETLQFQIPTKDAFLLIDVYYDDGTSKSFNINFRYLPSSSPSPSPIPSPSQNPVNLGVIRGYKVLMPGNIKNHNLFRSSVSVSGGRSSIYNPFEFRGLAPGIHTVAVYNYPGYKLGFSGCYNSSDCHDNVRYDFSKVTNNLYELYIETNNEDKKEVDLWFHYFPISSPEPSSLPSPTPSSLAVTSITTIDGKLLDLTGGSSVEVPLFQYATRNQYYTTLTVKYSDQRNRYLGIEFNYNPIPSPSSSVTPNPSPELIGNRLHFPSNGQKCAYFPLPIKKKDTGQCFYSATSCYDNEEYQYDLSCDTEDFFDDTGRLWMTIGGKKIDSSGVNSTSIILSLQNDGSLDLPIKEGERPLGSIKFIYRQLPTISKAECNSGVLTVSWAGGGSKYKLRAGMNLTKEQILDGVTWDASHPTADDIAVNDLSTNSFTKSVGAANQFYTIWIHSEGADGKLSDKVFYPEKVTCTQSTPDSFRTSLPSFTSASCNNGVINISWTGSGSSYELRGGMNLTQSQILDGTTWDNGHPNANDLVARNLTSTSFSKNVGANNQYYTIWIHSRNSSAVLSDRVFYPEKVYCR